MPKLQVKSKTNLTNLKLITVILKNLKDSIMFYINSKPIVANYEISANCNLRCYGSGCYFFKGNGKSKYKDLSLNEWSERFKTDRKNGINKAFLTGGEPMLRQDVIKEAYKIFNSNIQMVTNGTIPVPREPGYPPNYFVSIDGNRKCHNKIRGLNIFDKIMKNVKGDKRVVFAPVLSRLNKDQVFNIVEETLKAEVRGVIFSFFTPGKKGSELVLKGMELDKVIDDIRKAKKDYGKIIMVSEKMLNILKNKSHVKNCYLRKKWAITYDPEGKIKTPCVLGEDVKCSECGCVVPIIIEGIKKLDFKQFVQQ